jgi:hypothetical protein
MSSLDLDEASTCVCFFIAYCSTAPPQYETIRYGMVHWYSIVVYCDRIMILSVLAGRVWHAMCQSRIYWEEAGMQVAMCWTRLIRHTYFFTFFNPSACRKFDHPYLVRI